MVASPAREGRDSTDGDDLNFVAAVTVQQLVRLGFADLALTATGLAPERPHRL